jgi:monovalent cation:H+ antiporter-2, CPA2 family
MHGLAPLIYDLAIMLGVAGIVTVIFQRIHQPVVLGYLVAGIIIGPYTPPYSLVSDIPNIQTLSELGVIFLMFSLGLEFSFHKLMRVGFSASITGLIEVLLMILVGYICGQLIGWSYYDSLFLGAALSISSTTIIIKAIDELGLKAKRFSELIFGILIIEDLLAVLLLVALSTVVITQNVFSLDMLLATTKLFLVVGGWFLAGYFFVPPIFRLIASHLSEETLTIISIALCLFLVCIAVYFNYTAALGAFIMGSILGETILVHRIVSLVTPIRDIFAAVFFISVGMLIDPRIIVQQWPIILFLSLITIFGKLIVTSIAAFLTGQSLYTSLRVGFGMAQIGEFSFIIIALGIALKVINKELYPIIVAVSGITTFTTPYLIRLSGYISKTLERQIPERIKYFLDSYSTWVYRTQTATQKSSLFQKITVRLILNGIIVAIIFTLIDHLISPKLNPLFQENWLSNTLGLLIALAISSPFIWGMLFSFKAEKIPEYAKTEINPIIFAIWFITLLEIFLLSLLYFHNWLTIIFIIFTAAIFFIFFYRHLEKSYHWFEQ